MNTKETVELFIARVEAQNFDEGFGMLAEGGEYTLIGTTPLSRTYHGRKDMFENLLGVLGGFTETPVLKLQRPIIDGDRAVILGEGKGVGPTGPYNQPYYAFVMTVKDGEFSSVIEFLDTEMLQSAAFGG